MEDFALPPINDPLAAPFWDWIAKGELRLPQRPDATFDWYPTGAPAEWVRLSGRATLYSWAVVTRPLDPRYARIVPYTAAIVLLDDAPGVRFVTRLIDMDRPLEAGMPLTLRIVDIAAPTAHAGVPAPLFSAADLHGDL